MGAPCDQARSPRRLGVEFGEPVEHECQTVNFRSLLIVALRQRDEVLTIRRRLDLVKTTSPKHRRLVLKQQARVANRQRLAGR